MPRSVALRVVVLAAAVAACSAFILGSAPAQAADRTKPGAKRSTHAARKPVRARKTEAAKKAADKKGSRVTTASFEGSLAGWSLAALPPP